MNRKLVLMLIVLLGLHFFNYGIEKMNMKNYIYDGFSWIIDKKLSGMPFPGVFDPEDDDIKFIQDKGITLLVSLTLKTPDKILLKKAGIRSSHYPVKDFHAPTVDQLNQFCVTADKEINGGGRVAVHCYAGKGRTGTFLAAYFVYKGAGAEGSIELIRKLRPGSIETEEQEDSVREFEKYLKQE